MTADNRAASLADRIAGWQRDRGIEWGRALRGWADGLRPAIRATLPQGAEELPDWSRVAVGGSQLTRGAVQFFAGTMGMFHLVGATTEAIYGRALQLIRKEHRPHTISAEVAATAEVQGVVDHVVGLDIAGRNGLPDSDYQTLVSVAGDPLPPHQLLELWNRGTIGEAEVDRGLKQSRLKNEWIASLKSLRFPLFTAGELIHMAVREVFSPQDRAALSLDEDYPELLTERLRAVGMSPEQGRDAWAAHWELPAPGQVFEMLHRRLITPDQVDAYLKAADYAPTWRGLLKAISYSPFTRVDVRRVFKLGLATRQVVYDNYRDLGYDDARAEYLTKFTEADVSVERTQERELLTAPLRTRAISLYNAGNIGAETLTTILTQLRYTPEQIARYIEEAEFIREADRLTELAAALKSGYVKGLRTWDETAAVFAEEGYDAAQIAETMYAWDVLRQNTELSAAQVAERDLTRADILGARQDELVTLDVATAMLTEIGYSAEEAALLIGRVELARERKLLDAEIDRVHVLFTGGRLDVADASIQLDELRVSPARKQTLLATWDAERLKRRPDFGLPLLMEMRKANTITDQDMDAELDANGWADWQRRWLIAFATGKRAEDAEKAAAKLAAATEKASRT